MKEILRKFQLQMGQRPRPVNVLYMTINHFNVIHRPLQFERRNKECPETSNSFAIFFFSRISFIYDAPCDSATPRRINEEKEGEKNACIMLRPDAGHRSLMVTVFILDVKSLNNSQLFLRNSSACGWLVRCERTSWYFVCLKRTGKRRIRSYADVQTHQNYYS